MSGNGLHVIAQNRKARFNYEILSTWEAGLVLTGTEIKSLRGGRVQLKDGYAKIEGDEAFLHDVYIAPYPNAGPAFNHEPTRVRKLLLHKQEIQRLYGKIQEKGLALVPLRLYLRRGKAKVELGLGRGKRKYEKRETIRRRESKREIRDTLRKNG